MRMKGGMMTSNYRPHGSHLSYLEVIPNLYVLFCLVLNTAHWQGLHNAYNLSDQSLSAAPLGTFSFHAVFYSPRDRL